MEALSQLKAGESFADVVAKYSDEPGAAREGCVGTIRRSVMTGDASSATDRHAPHSVRENGWSASATQPSFSMTKSRRMLGGSSGSNVRVSPFGRSTTVCGTGSVARKKPSAASAASTAARTSASAARTWVVLSMRCVSFLRLSREHLPRELWWRNTRSRAKSGRSRVAVVEAADARQRDDVACFGASTARPAGASPSSAMWGRSSL
jgi:hypothetical protein